MNIRINKYENLFFGLGFVGNLVYGVILDKVRTMKVVYPTLIFGMVGYMFILLAEDD